MLQKACSQSDILLLVLKGLQLRPDTPLIGCHKVSERACPQGEVPRGSSKHLPILLWRPSSVHAGAMTPTRTSRVPAWGMPPSPVKWWTRRSLSSPIFSQGDVSTALPWAAVFSSTCSKFILSALNCFTTLLTRVQQCVPCTRELSRCLLRLICSSSQISPGQRTASSLPDDLHG